MLNTQQILIARPTGMPSNEHFELRYTEIPALQDGEVLVEVDMISIDPAMRGWMNEGKSYIPGVELGAVMRAGGAGRVLASQHPDFQAGDVVSGGTNVQTHAILAGKTLSKINLDLAPMEEHLGVLGMPGLTAYFGLLDKGQPQAGNTVVITGAAGIVGMTVGQIAKIKGCRVIGTAGSSEKCQFLTEQCGFDAAINYKTDDLRSRLREFCPNGIDVVFENVGGPTLDHCLTRLARNARVVICGAISQYNEQQVYGPKNYLALLTTRSTMSGFVVFDYAKQYAEGVRALATWLKTGQLTTKTDLYQGIENFPATLQKLYTGENFGKVVLQFTA
jgi:NADPH-dependent curcumin reductase